ncbi:hypothetical protein VNO77_19431 [Canavalia gladiata]|uniref:Uncharacterized protein n=1 Tax=Canavalia gladiata TaxID=3824 RepID=A0AAN9LQX6_CANGL
MSIRNLRDSWTSPLASDGWRGSYQTLQRATEKAKVIMATHEDPLLGDAMVKEQSLFLQGRMAGLSP